MKNRINYGLLVFLYIILFSSNAFAKTYAWLTTVDKAYKLDVAANKIIQTKEPIDLRSSVSLQNTENAKVADTSANLLFVIYDKGKFMGQGVKIYNLKDLSFRKDLGITSNDPSLNLPRIIAPPVGNKFYVIWWDSSKEVNGEGGETYSVYDKTTLNKIGDLTSFPINVYRPYMFSSDGSKLYSVYVRTNEIKVYDSIALALLETISIANIWGTPLYSKILESDADFLGSGDKFLFGENLKNIKSDPNNLKSFVYNISTKSISNKITIQEASDRFLTPDGSKIVTNEISYVRNEIGTITEIKHLNKINIYDVATGQKLRYLDLSDKYKSIGISGISPDSSKLYLAAENIQTGATTIIVVNLKPPYNIISYISVEGTWMIFFEE